LYRAKPDWFGSVVVQERLLKRSGRVDYVHWSAKFEGSEGSLQPLWIELPCPALHLVPTFLERVLVHGLIVLVDLLGLEEELCAEGGQEFSDPGSIGLVAGRTCLTASGYDYTPGAKESSAEPRSRSNQSEHKVAVHTPLPNPSRRPGSYHGWPC
jgi:hypothetical protein